MNSADLDRALKALGHPGITWWYRTSFDGGTMTQLNERDEPMVTRFPNEDAMFRSLFADAAMDLPPRTGALLHPSAITHLPSRALWRVALPAHSMMKDRANGLLAMMDTSGLIADPGHGALQITILDAATGVIRASWIPPHAATWVRFDGDDLVVDDQRENASICDPLTGRVLGPTEPGVRVPWKNPILPFLLDANRNRSELRNPDGILLWERKGFVRYAHRTHGMSVIGRDDGEVEAVLDDGTSLWTVKGALATVTPGTVWVDAGSKLRIIETLTGRQLSKQPAPWGEDKLYGLENGYSDADGLVLISSEEDLAAYAA